MSRRNRKNRKQGVEKPKDPSRRRFSKGLAAALGLAAIPASIYVGSHLFRDDRWDFLARNEWHKIILDWQKVIERYAPAGPEIEIKGRNNQKLKKIQKSVTPFLYREIEIRGFDLKGDYDVKAYRQMFCVPDKEEFREPALEYCKTAFEYLYDHPKLSGLKKSPLDWITAKGADHEKGFNEKGFIGNSYYEIQKVKVVNKSDPGQNFENGRARHGCSSRFIVAERDEKEGHLKSWFIYISSVEPRVLLFAPFSEIIPLTIDAATIRYEDEVGTEKATQAGETISEGLSHLLALEISDELGIPNGKKLARESIAKIKNNEMYKYLPNSVAWIRKNSMQAALDLYIESAAKFMEAVMKI